MGRIIRLLLNNAAAQFALPNGAAVALATDPVCGMTVDPATALSRLHAGKIHYFCAAHCRETFRADLERYLSPTIARDEVEPPAAGKAEYTCPLHPEIIRDLPGTCPLCGMALGPVLPSLDDDNPELRDFTRRFWWTLPLTLVIFTLSMNRNPEVGWIKRSGSILLTIVPGFSSAAWWIRFFVAAFVFVPCLIRPTITNRVHGSSAVLAAPTRAARNDRTPTGSAGSRRPIVAGICAFISRRVVGGLAVLCAVCPVNSIRKPYMWTLIGIGVGAALLYSVAAIIAPQWFPASFIVHGRVGVYFEAAAVIVSLTLLGQMLELKARSQTSAAIKALLGLTPKTARRINADGSEEDVPLTHVHVGDVLRVRPGEKVPVDGRRSARHRPSPSDLATNGAQYAGKSGFRFDL